MSNVLFSEFQMMYFSVMNHLNVSRLNQDQERAVNFPFARHCLVLAGAGCGKTTVLTRRILHCAASHCPPERICALTFTVRAAGEMRERIMAQSHAGQRRPYIATFHGLGNLVVRRSRELSGETRRLCVLSALERMKLLAAVSTVDERRALSLDIGGLDDILARCESGQRPEVLFPGVLESIRQRFADRKKESGLVDYADMMSEAVRALETDSGLCRRVQQAFSYLLVDEFQDTSPVQIRLLRLVLGETTSLFAVGDDDQAVYGFRGADSSIIRSFTREFAGADVVKLEHNYRSSMEILGLANRIFSDKPSVLRKVLKCSAHKAGGVGPVHIHCADVSEAAVRICRAISHAGISFSDCAFLCRTNRNVAELSEVLQAPCSAEGGALAIMTIHAAKGLEFPAVFLCDMEEGSFPCYRIRRRVPIRSGYEAVLRFFEKEEAPECDMEEERRLFYVGVTRAQQHLYLISIGRRMVRGRPVLLQPSRFLRYLKD